MSRAKREATVPATDTPRPTAITVSDVVDTALRIIDTRGLQSLSIRTIAADLSLSPMSVYKYVGSKTELLDLVLLRIISLMEIPPAFETDWMERIITTMSAWRQLLLAHPDAVPLLMERPIPRGSDGLARMQESILASLEQANIVGTAAAQAFWQIFTVTVGHVMFELPRRELTDESVRAHGEELANIARERGLSRTLESADALASVSLRPPFTATLRTLLRGLDAPANP